MLLGIWEGAAHHAIHPASTRCESGLNYQILLNTYRYSSRYYYHRSIATIHGSGTQNMTYRVHTPACAHLPLNWTRASVTFVRILPNLSMQRWAAFYLNQTEADEHSNPISHGNLNNRPHLFCYIPRILLVDLRFSISATSEGLRRSCAFGLLASPRLCYLLPEAASVHNMGNYAQTPSTKSGLWHCGSLYRLNDLASHDLYWV